MFAYRKKIGADTTRKPEFLVLCLAKQNHHRFLKQVCCICRCTAVFLQPPAYNVVVLAVYLLCRCPVTGSHCCKKLLFDIELALHLLIPVFEKSNPIAGRNCRKCQDSAIKIIIKYTSGPGLCPGSVPRSHCFTPVPTKKNAPISGHSNKNKNIRITVQLRRSYCIFLHRPCVSASGDAFQPSERGTSQQFLFSPFSASGSHYPLHRW